MEIVFSDEIKIEFKKMMLALHHKKYFGTSELAQNYVNKIIDFITTIPNLSLRKCKIPIYGAYFARYDSPKSNMQYFITYNIIGDIYYIEHIISSKMPAYTAILGLK